MAALSDDAKATVERYLETLELAAIVDGERLRQAIHEFRVRTRPTPQMRVSVAALGRFLQDERLITPWQHTMLIEGRHKGFVLGKYTLLDYIGSGGMSSVYLAEHRAMKRRVALKVLHPARVDQKTFLPRFIREARAIGTLDHPNVVKVFDVDNQDKTFFMAMEYVEGVDLQRRVDRKGVLGFSGAALCIRQAADGLAHAHSRGVIHRDIKPANLLVDKTQTLKILDLGLVQLAGGEDRSLTVDHNERVLGTADYLAPEQAVDSHNIDSRADLYSLGCTLYFLLSGSPPFPQGTVVERLIKHQSEEPRPLESWRPDTPPGLLAICRKMMSKSPDRRYQSAEEVSKVVDRWLNERDRIPEFGPVAVAAPAKKRQQDSGEYDFRLGPEPGLEAASSSMVDIEPSGPDDPGEFFRRMSLYDPEPPPPPRAPSPSGASAASKRKGAKKKSGPWQSFVDQASALFGGGGGSRGKDRGVKDRGSKIRGGSPGRGTSSRAVSSQAVTVVAIVVAVAAIGIVVWALG